MGDFALSLEIEGLSGIAEIDDYSAVEFTADFGKSEVQPVIGVEQLTFVNKSADFIINHYNNGDILQRIGLTLRASTNTSSVVQKLLIDLTQNFKIIDETKCECQIIADNNIQDFEEKIKALTFDFFDQTENFPSYTVSVAVVRVNIGLELAMISGLIAAMTVEIIRTVQNLAQQVSNFISKLAGGLFGSLVAAIYAAAMIAVNIAMFYAMVIAYKKTIEEFFELVLPLPFDREYIQPIEILEIVFKKLGYKGINTTKEIRNISYLSSFKKDYNTGLPNDFDSEQRINQMLLLVLKMTNSIIKVDNNKNVLIYPEGDDFWRKRSTYVMPDVLNEVFSPNIEDLTPVKIFQYQGDGNNEHTRLEYKGTSYKVITESTTNNDKTAIPKGLNDVFFGVQIANAKTDLTGVEKAIDPLLDAFNKFSAFLGGSDTLFYDFSKTIGALKVSNDDWSLPIVWNGKATNNSQNWVLPNDYRKLTANYIYHNWYSSNSFVLGDKLGQKLYKASDNLPMTLEDFVSLVNEPRFSTHDGKNAQMTKISYVPEDNVSNVEFFLNEPYTNKLKETYIEQE